MHFIHDTTRNDFYISKTENLFKKIEKVVGNFFEFTNFFILALIITPIYLTINYYIYTAYSNLFMYSEVHNFIELLSMNVLFLFLFAIFIIAVFATGFAVSWFHEKIKNIKNINYLLLAILVFTSIMTSVTMFILILIH